jgi:ATP diphosphatase
VEAELGDLIFCVCNLAFMLKLSPEDALRRMLGRFERRFRFIEEQLRSQGRTPDQATLEEMDSLWNQAKSGEKTEEAPR